MVGFYREPGDAATGVFPQETRLLPIVARPPADEREDVSVINSLQIWSPVAGRMIPLNQVTSGAEVVWEDPIIMRRNRFPTLTVHADPRYRTAQRVVRAGAIEDRADRAAAGLFAGMGRRARGFQPTPAPPWPGPSLTSWRSWCSSACACSIRSAPRS